MNDVKPILMNIEWMSGETVQDKFDMVMTHRSTNVLMKAIKRLHAVGLLNGEAGRLYFSDLVASRSPGALSEGYVLLHERGLLLGEGAAYYRGILKDQKQPNPIAKAFLRLVTAGILSSEVGPVCAEVVMASSSPEVVAEAFALFKERSYLTAETINYIRMRRELNSMVDGIRNLKTAGLLVGERGAFYFNTIILQHKKPWSFTNVLILLQKLGLWDDSYFALLNQDEYPLNHLFRALTVLNDVGILGGPFGLVHLNFLLSYPDIQEMSKTLAKLQLDNLLIGERAEYYCRIIYQHKAPYSAASALSTLHKAGLIDEGIFTNVFSTSMPARLWWH
jgi:hypothetical protein